MTYTALHTTQLSNFLHHWADMIVCMQLSMLYVSAGHPSSGVTVGNEDAPGGWSAGGLCVCVCVWACMSKDRGKGVQSFSEERREEKSLKKRTFEIHSNGPKFEHLFLLSLLLQLCTGHWRASPVTLMFICGMQDVGGGGIYTSLSCWCAMSIILFSLRLDGTCPLFTWKLLLRITPFSPAFVQNPTYIWWIQRLAKYIV